MKKDKSEEILRSMNAIKQIDTKVVFKIPKSTEVFDPGRHKYKCSCCGKGFTSQKNNFQKTYSPLFQSNDGFLPWCKECSDKYMALLTALYSNNEEHAIEHFCQQADWVYDIEPLKCSIGPNSRGSRLANYSAKKNLNVGNRKTYIDTIQYNYRMKKDKDEIISSRTQAKSEASTVSVSAVDRWGVGLGELDYKVLDDHYKMLKKNNPNCDSNQEIFIKSLCNINMFMMRALRSNDSDKYVKLTEQYAKTFRNAGLKTVEEKDASNDETFCMTLGFISDYTPEEFYKDKTLYKDYDKLGEYIDRHITRPMRNLIEGTNVRDKEYFVPETDEYGEE